MIVLCNDDGFNADGIRAIYKELAKFAEVMIVAPETEQSAMGHAITLTQPIKVRKVVEKGEFIGYAVNGTPADCIKIATATLFNRPPEMVVSGVNQGGNLGTCALYSGTVSAATEATIEGIPAIAIGGGGQGSGAHSPGEWFINRDGALGIQRALLILLAQAGTGVTS